MSKEEWIEQAARILARHLTQGQSADYADSLYQTYVVEDGDHWTPEEAVREDMNYWEME